MGMDGPWSIINSTSFEKPEHSHIITVSSSPVHGHPSVAFDPNMSIYLLLLCFRRVLSELVCGFVRTAHVDLVLCFHRAYRHQANRPISRRRTPSTSWSLPTHDNRLKQEECECPFSSSCLCIVLFCSGRHICVYFTLIVLSFSFLIRHISSGIADPIR